MIPTSNADTFEIDLIQRNGNEVKLTCRYATFNEHKQLVKLLSQMKDSESEEKYVELIQPFLDMIVNQDAIDSLSWVDILQFKNSYIDEATLSEFEKKRLLLQPQASSPEVETQQ